MVSQGGLFDMLRAELSENGEFDVPEYGSTNDIDQFHALLAYSPYHNIDDKAAYPAALFITSQNDKEIEPFHSFKMAAQLQSASSKTILIKTHLETGCKERLPYLQGLQEETEIMDETISILKELSVI